MNMLCFSVYNSATAHCDEFYPSVAILAFQYDSPYFLIVGPKCVATKDIFGFVLTNKDKKSSMACLSIIIFGCRRNVRLVGIVERRVFFVVLYTVKNNLWWSILFFVSKTCF
jgi:hypothetical protein